MTWKKIYNAYNQDTGETLIRYRSGAYAIESWKRPIKHANGIGSWMYTSYFLVLPDGTRIEKHTLRDAKELAEVEALVDRLEADRA